jgi:hypothetical protein
VTELNDDTQADAEIEAIADARHIEPLEVTIKPGDEMNDVHSEKFVSKFNLLDDREFEKAMKAIRERKKQQQQQC